MPGDAMNSLRSQISWHSLSPSASVRQHERSSVKGLSCSFCATPRVFLRVVQLPRFEHDHVLVKADENGVGQPCASIEKSSLQKVDGEELDERPAREPIEKFLLVA